MAHEQQAILQAINALLSRGVRYTRQSQFEEAETCLWQALEIAAERLDGSQTLIDCRACLANVYIATARFEEAGTLLDEALEEARRLGEEPALMALLLNNRGGAFRESSRPAEALPLFFKAAELEQDEMGRAQAEENAALCLGSMARFEEARMLFEKSLETRMVRLPEDHPLVLRNLNNLALLNHQSGDFGRARSGFNKALSHLVPRRDTALLRATILNNRGMLAHETGDYGAAAADFQEAVALFRTLLEDDHPTTVTAVSNWGMLLLDAGDFEAAEPLLRECAEIRRRTGPIADRATSLNILGLLCLRTRRLDEAESLLTEAIRINGSVDDELVARTADVSRNNLALVLIEQGRFGEARQLLDVVVRWRRDKFGADHPHTEQALFNCATTLARLGEHAEARRFLDAAAQIDERALRQVFSTAADSERHAFLLQLRTRWNVYLSVVRNDGGADAITAGCEFVLRRRALGLEALLAQMTFGQADEVSEISRSFRELMRVLREINSLAAGSVRSESETRRGELARRQAALERDLAGRIPSLASNVDQKTSVEDVRAALPARAALVEIARLSEMLVVGEPGSAEGRYIAFVLRHADGAPILVDLGRATEIDERIAAYLNLMNADVAFNPKFEADERIAAKPLLESIAPLLDVLEGCTQVFVAPDGEFSRLPLPVLPIGPGRRFIDVAEISFVTSGRDFLRRGKAAFSVNLGPALVLGDPEFDPTASQSRSQRGAEPDGRGLRARLRAAHDYFEPLPETRVEAQAVGEVLGVLPLLGRHALAQAVTGAHSPAILHLATHGFFLDGGIAAKAEMPSETGSKLSALVAEENPLLHSGIVLAGANVWLRGEDLGPDFHPAVLTAADLATCDLRGTQLVTLSACETGRGRVHAGEGVFGLQRGLVMAGAAAVTMSMWSVPDRETAHLMVLFYQNLTAADVTAALHRAQRAMKERTPDPRDWGAFVVLTARSLSGAVPPSSSLGSKPSRATTSRATG